MRPPSGRVVVVGSVNVDLVVRADRLPAAGETVVGRRLERYGGGKSANAAAAAARAGAAVEFVGAVGDDELGREALASLTSAGVGTAHVAVLEGEATGAALITVDEHGENQITVGAGANAAVPLDHVRTALAQLLPGAGCVVVGTEIALAAALAAVRFAHDAGVTCVLDPAPVVAGIEAALTDGPLLTPNAGECVELARRAGLPRDSTEVAARALSGRTGAAVVVTLGGDGMLLVEPGRDPVAVPAVDASVVDTTGAGDSATGTLAAELSAGTELPAALANAAAAAARTVARAGAR